MQKFQKKPITVEAVLTSDLLSQNRLNPELLPRWILKYYNQIQFEDDGMTIPTLEGFVFAKADDYIICGIKEEIYPCRKDIFEETYKLKPE